MNLRYFHARALLALVATSITLSGATLATAQERVEVEAFSGTPFGVGRITVRSGGDFRITRVPRPGRGRIADLAKRVAEQVGVPPGETALLQSAEVSLGERSARTFYPVFAKRERPILKQFLSTPSESTILFLFQGTAPLELTVYAPEARPSQVIPRPDAAGHARLLNAWWKDYSSAADGRNATREYPQMVEEYLTDTLARRLKLDLPRRQAGRELNLLRGELALLFEAESVRLDLAETILLAKGPVAAASESLPEELPVPKPEELDPLTEVAVEPMALRVPVECLYVRFGNFPNFLWLRHRMEDWGGELRDVFSERGLDFGINDRMQKQLGLREGALAEVLGDRVIADVALIGTDVFMREGAAIGTLFHAKSNAALQNDLTQQRMSSMREAKGTQEKLTIAGRTVSYVSTPDGTLRSYYVVDGDFHLVTTSRTLVEWFLATADGKHESIGKSAEFRYARRSVPQERNDTLFVYLSPEFFANLLSPHYRIELNRRLTSAVEMELFPIAQLAARGEQKPGDTIADLVAGEFLPPGFGEHADGSKLELKDGRLIDSVRGAKGSFVPVPDVAVGKVTPAEVAENQKFMQEYAEQWGRMDPIVVSIQRQALPEGKLERVVIDAAAAPLSKKHIETLSNWLGDPTDQRLAPVPGDVVSFEAVLRGGTFFSGDEHHMFGGLRNADPALALDPRASLIARVLGSQLEGVQGYLGAWPNPGFLRLIGATANAPPDARGYTQLVTGLWRRQFDAFTLMSFHPEILEQVTPQLQFVQAERPAQVWFRADDLANSTLAPLINAYGYRQSRQISAGNARYMNMLSEQLHVPPAEGMATAQRLLEAKFVAPLGGGYELKKWDSGLQSWVATALANTPDNAKPPADYQFRALTWLRGIQFELAMNKGPNPGLAAHGEFIMPVEERAPPAFQLPKLPFGLGGSGKPAADKATPPATKSPMPPGPSDAKGPPAKPSVTLPPKPGLQIPKSIPKPSGKRAF